MKNRLLRPFFAKLLDAAAVDVRARFLVFKSGRPRRLQYLPEDAS
jgi:hypothetical protein